MAAYIPLPGFIAHGFGRRPLRRRATLPVLVNWATYETATAGGFVYLDTKTLQLADQIDMVQCVKWDNPIGSAVWLQSDSGDLVKLPPYSSGIMPILIGQGDGVTAQLDPATPNVPPQWNTLLTFLAVQAEGAVWNTASPNVQFQAGAVGTNMAANYNPSLGGFVSTQVFDNIALSTSVATLVNLPQNASGTNQGGGAIIGMSLFFTPTGFTAAAVGEVDIGIANVNGVVLSFPIKLGIPISAAGQMLTYANPSMDIPWTYRSGTPFPQITGILPSSLSPGSLTISGSINLLLFP